MRLLTLIPVLLAFMVAPALAAKQTPTSPAEISLSFSPLVKQVSPAVVNVYTSKTVTQRQGGPGLLFQDPFFQRFFGRNFQFPQQPGRETKKKVQNSLGSGVIVSQDGMVVTNYHVIKGAEEISLVLSDRREYEADILLTDEGNDLAVLKIRHRDERFPALDIGDSDALEVGDLVMAIGNPFGVKQTVTTGVVSGLARTQVTDSDTAYFIQTDAAINPGNSGGALVDIQGRLVGVNTVILSKSGASHGIGFAIPANMVRTVVATAESGAQRIARPWLGIDTQDVDMNLALAQGLDRPYGVMVTSVYKNGPADDARIKEGDVILLADGYEVFDAESLNFRVATRPLGSELELTVLRGGREKTRSVLMEEAPEDPPRNLTKVEGRNAFQGVTLANMSPAFNNEVGLPTALEGVIVYQVQKRSFGRQFGLRPGDIVQSINGRPVEEVKDAMKIIRRANGQDWNARITRNGRMTELRGRL